MKAALALGVALALLSAPAVADEAAGGEDPAAIYEEAKTKLAAGDADTAARLFARADELAPHPSALEAALLAVIETDDAELGRELAERAARAPEDAKLQELAERARDKFGPAPPPPDPPPPPAPPPPPEPPAVIVDASGGGLSPVYFWVGLGLTAGMGIGTGVSFADLSSIHGEFVDDPTASLASRGESAQLRTQVLLGVTCGLAATTAVLGIVAEWSDETEQVSLTWNGTSGSMRWRF